MKEVEFLQDLSWIPAITCPQLYSIRMMSANDIFNPLSLQAFLCKCV